MVTITDKYPPLSWQEIRAIQDLSSNNVFNSTETALISKLVKHHPTLGGAVGTGQIWWRARPSPEDGSKYNHIKELLSPPASSAKQARMNNVNNTVLYLADRKDTALSETFSGNDNAAAHFVGLEVKDGHKSFLTLIGEIFDIYRRGAGQIISGQAAHTVNNLINACNRDEAARLIISDRILLELLCNGDNYAATSFVAELVRSKSPQADGILYPSVKQYGARNLALTRTATAKNWTIKSIFSAENCLHLGFGLWEPKKIAHVDKISSTGNLSYSDFGADEGCYHLFTEPVEIQLGIHMH